MKNPFTTNKERNQVMKLISYTTPDHLAWSPFRRISPFSELLDTAWNISGAQGNAFVPPLEVLEDTEKVTVAIEAAGLSKADFDIALEDGTLTISGTRPSKGSDATPLVSEFRSGTFQRSISLPCPVKSEDVSASYDAGILTITLPKEDEAKPSKISIN